MKPSLKLAPIIFLALVLWSGITSALTPVLAGLSLTISFKKFSSELSAEQQNEIRAAFQRIAAEDWCPFSRGFIVGRASEDEGTEDEREALARVRADNVKRFVDEIGFPKERTSLLAPNSTVSFKSVPRSEVELRFDGWPGRPNCPFPKNANGLRIEP